MRSSSFPEIPVSPSICHRTDFENIRSTTTDERMSEGEPLDWPLSCPDRLQGEEHLVPPPHLCRWRVSVGVNRQLLTYWRPTMCKAQWELQAWDLFTPSPAPLQLLCHTHTQKKYLPGHVFLFVFVDRLRLRGRKVLLLKILRDVMSTSGVLHCQFAFSEWVISMYLRSSQPCSLLHILYAQWVLVNWFGTSMWQHKYMMKNEESKHQKC